MQLIVLRSAMMTNKPSWNYVVSWAFIIWTLRYLSIHSTDDDRFLFQSSALQILSQSTKLLLFNHRWLWQCMPRLITLQISSMRVEQLETYGTGSILSTPEVVQNVYLTRFSKQIKLSREIKGSSGYMWHLTKKP